MTIDPATKQLDGTAPTSNTDPVFPYSSPKENIARQQLLRATKQLHDTVRQQLHPATKLTVNQLEAPSAHRTDGPRASIDGQLDVPLKNISTPSQVCEILLQSADRQAASHSCMSILHTDEELVVPRWPTCGFKRAQLSTKASWPGDPNVPSCNANIRRIFSQTTEQQEVLSYTSCTETLDKSQLNQTTRR